MALPVGERYFDRNGLRYHPGQNDIKLALESCPGIVEGTILEQGSHAPISGARVWLRAEGSHVYGAPTHQVHSDAAGKFRFSQLLAGRYQVYAAVETNAVSVWDVYATPVVVSNAPNAASVVMTAIKGGIAEVLITAQTNGLSADWPMSALIQRTEGGGRQRNAR